MPKLKFYKGAGPGTFFHERDARTLGFAAATRSPPGRPAVIQHITLFSKRSPYLSITSSFAVALEYARFGPSGVANRANPGFVYVLELDVPGAVTLINPLEVISQGLMQFGTIAHHHTGDQKLLAGLSGNRKAVLSKKVAYGPNKEHRRPPVVTQDFEALSYALRDAEVLVENEIPKDCVVDRWDVF